jgi:hypothetical protein
MKKKISIIILSIVIGVISIIGVISAKANDNGISITINCPSIATAGAQINCTINSSSNISLAGVFAKYNFSTGILFNNLTTANGFTNPSGSNSTGFTIMNTNGFSGNVTLGTLQVTIPSNATSNQIYKIGLTSINPSDVNYNDYFLQDVSSDVRIISNNDKLSSLSITGGSINFNTDTLTYSTTIDSSSATISATVADSNAVVTGTGNVSLNYGNNTFNITVKSEAGTTRTYTINVNRPDNRSTNNNLSSLSVDIGNISFNKNTTSYKLTTKSSSVNISASKEDSRASITGDIGSKGLNIGTNTFRINVVAGNGSTKTYTITIVRESDQKQDTTLGNKNSNNNLSSLFVTNTNIVFDKNTTVYNLTTTANSTYISASRETTTATITGDTGKHDLKVGKNQFIIRVIAENGSKKTYTINITREESKSNNNYLKSLTLSNGNINFKKTTTEYNIDVTKDIDKITIEATLEDSKSSFENGFGPRTSNLLLGNNTIYIKVKSESGQVKTYTLNINRDDGRDSDSSLKNIKLSSGKLKFNKDTLEYKVTVEYNIDKMQIEATPNSEKAKVTINGNDNLRVGDNVFKINVEAENGKVTIYSINVVRKEQGEKISNNNSIKSITIKNHSIDFKSNVYKYTIKVNEKELDLTITLDDENATYKIFGNENLKNGSEIKIKVTAENGEEKTYTLVIKKSNLGLIIGIICIIALIGSGIGTWIFFKNKKKPSIETFDANDFNQTTINDLPKSLYDIPSSQSDVNNNTSN